MQRELSNVQWRTENNMTNHKYLNRRNIKFFEGTLSQLNCRELIIDSHKKRDRKVNTKRQSTNLRLLNKEQTLIDIDESNSKDTPLPPKNSALLTLPPLDLVNDP